MKMTGNELQTLLDQMNLEQLDLAALVGTDGRTVRRWKLEERSIPPAIQHLIFEWSEHPASLRRAWIRVGLPDGRKAAPRGRPKKEATNGQ